MTDVLTDVLQRVSLRGTVYFQADFGAPWGMEAGGSQLANFHLVTGGRCWVSMPTQGWSSWLEDGDVVLFPQGTSHVLASDPKCRAVPAGELLAGADGNEAAPTFGGDGTPTRLICGHFERRADSRHPLFGALPDVIHLSSGIGETAPWFATAALMAADESRASNVGGAAIVDRLAEVLLIHLLRAWSVEEGSEQHTFLTALADPQLGSALALMHKDPLHEWSLDELARRAGLSRSALSSRFRAAVGVSPIRYLTQWRLERAYHGISVDAWTLQRAAIEAGYADEFSFSRAFKRLYGVSPGSVRRAHAS